MHTHTPTKAMTRKRQSATVENDQDSVAWMREKIREARKMRASLMSLMRRMSRITFRLETSSPKSIASDAESKGRIDSRSITNQPFMYLIERTWTSCTIVRIFVSQK